MATVVSSILLVANVVSNECKGLEILIQCQQRQKSLQTTRKRYQFDQNIYFQIPQKLFADILQISAFMKKCNKNPNMTIISLKY